MTYRNARLLAAIRDLPCAFCGRDGNDYMSIVPAHSNQLRDGKGRGIKASDYRVAAACPPCHHELDQGAKWSREERVARWEEAHRKTIGWLFEAGRLVVK